MSTTIYTPVPRNEILRPTVFEYTASIRIHVESSYFALTNGVDPAIQREAITQKHDWMRGEWNPEPVRSNRDLTLVALQKIAAYLDVPVATRTNDPVEFERQLSHRYSDEYRLALRDSEALQKIATWRGELGIEEGGAYFGSAE